MQQDSSTEATGRKQQARCKQDPPQIANCKLQIASKMQIANCKIQNTNYNQGSIDKMSNQNQSAVASTQNQATATKTAKAEAAEAEAAAAAARSAALMQNATAKLAELLDQAKQDQANVDDLLHQNYSDQKQAKDTVKVKVASDKMTFALTLHQATVLQNAKLIANATEASRITFNSAKAPALFAKVYAAIEASDILQVKLVDAAD